jgi:hypothetical protein
LVNEREWLAMSVFTFRCFICGAAVEIPGRFGFKLKSSGAGRLLCQRCRQSSFLKARREQLDQAIEAEIQRVRWVPAAAVALALTLAISLVWWHQAQQNRPQDSLPERVSSSR